MGKYVEIRKPMISAEKVLERWPGVLERELAYMIDNSADPFEGYPTAYRVQKVLSDGNGGIIAECATCEPDKGEKYYSPYQIHYQGNDALYDFSGIAFKLAEIVEYGQKNPKVFYKIVDPDEAWSTDAAGANEETLHAGLATLSANVVINRLKITPFDLVQILNGVDICDDYNNYVATKRLVTTDEEGFRAHTYSEPYFTEEALKSVKIYQLNFDRYCEEWKIQEQAQSEVVDISALEAQLAEAQKQIESLRQWNKRLNEQNQELRAELAAAQETQPAAVGPTTTVDAAKWENSVKAVLEIWAEIVQGDKTDWKEDECRAALAKRYSGYHTKVHSLAWSLLPGAFKHGRGRPKKNPEKSQQTDNI